MLSPIVLIVAGVAVVTLVVWAILNEHGNNPLTNTEAESVASSWEKLKKCACDETTLAYIGKLTVTGQFNPGDIPEGDDVSETRKTLAGRSSFTILSADFFDRPTCSQYKTLIHEAFHAGSWDFTEDFSYTFTEDTFKKMAKCLGC